MPGTRHPAIRANFYEDGHTDGPSGPNMYNYVLAVFEGRGSLELTPKELLGGDDEPHPPMPPVQAAGAGRAVVEATAVSVRPM